MPVISIPYYGVVYFEKPSDEAKVIRQLAAEADVKIAAFAKQWAPVFEACHEHTQGDES